jgi:hypothetical protein
LAAVLFEVMDKELTVRRAAPGERRGIPSPYEGIVGIRVHIGIAIAWNPPHK